jgi:hypothetical protein
MDFLRLADNFPSDLPGAAHWAVEVMSLDTWPALPYEEWRDTLDTLHMYTQVVGKLRLAQSPFEAEWANVALYLTPRGLTTSAIPHGLANFDAEFDFVDHELVIRTSNGAVERIALTGQDVADFYHQVMNTLQQLGVPVTITELPQEVPNPIPFPKDREHHTYDPAQARRFWEVLARIDAVMKRHRARFWGQTSPVHFFWGSFDLATTRFSGRPATPPAGAGTIMRYSEDAEQIAAGFWPGDERMPFPAFFAYGYPQPSGCEGAVCQPEGASWIPEAGLFVLRYDDVREAPDPAQALTEFLESTYEACAELMDWPDGLLGHPTPNG